uniref:C2H2-type domain-containing protein n=1 Tax=Stegastes partitus TaxID=144197 RepID=A0A3B5A0U1_9TELE
MRSHTSQTQFLCSVCGKDFAWRRHLTKHMEDHAKKKLYHCGICGRKFTCPKKLSHHWCVRRSSQLLLSSSAEHMEADGEDCGEPEPEPYLQAETEDKAAESSDPDTDDSDCWKENRRAQYTSEKHHEVPESDTTLYRKTFIQQLPYGEDLSQHMVFHSELQREEKQKDIQEEQEEPELTAIKEEQEDTAITKFIFSSLQIKTEEDEEKPQSSHSSEETNLQPESDDSTDSDFWKSHSGSNSLQHDGISDREVKDDAKRKPYSCTECSKTFHYIFHMKTHMKLHTEERPFFCSICGQKCLYKSHLKIHMRTHTGEKPFVCPICGKKYAHKASMQSHMSEHAKHYSCSVCERSFAWYTELKYHQCHTGKNRFSCSLCGKSFSKIAGLSYHLKIHSGEKSFSCSVCRKKFRKKGHLKYHVLIHTGVKPFSCSVCHRTFRWPSQIKIHKCVQEAPQCLHNKLKKPLSCSTCGEKFSDGSLLTSHRRIHQEKKKMLSCSVCGLHLNQDSTDSTDMNKCLYALVKMMYIKTVVSSSDFLDSHF